MCCYYAYYFLRGMSYYYSQIHLKHNLVYDDWYINLNNKQKHKEIELRFEFGS